ncbi:MAG: hypothetical protein BWY89_01616 [Bacteroidetes bacterium ADurb.BinA012]|nr:MAG: hypothetical protein BWY89_01616 [Bacteroidetes bacterium ADurb.BinA012]
MEVGLQPLAADTDGIVYTRLVVNDIGLRYDMNYLLTHINGELVHVSRQTAYVVYVNLRLMGVARDITAGHLAFDVPAGDTDKDVGKDEACSFFKVIYGSSNGPHRLFNVKHHTALDPCRGCVAKSEYLNTPVAVTAPYNSNDLRRANVNGCY